MRRLCSHKGCYAFNAPCGLGWGLGTGLVLWYCPLHLAGAIVRLSRLLETTRRRSATA